MWEVTPAPFTLRKVIVDTSVWVPPSLHILTLLLHTLMRWDRQESLV